MNGRIELRQRTASKCAKNGTVAFSELQTIMFGKVGQKS